MKVIYRISDTGYNKVKPNYINNEKCLSNFCWVFSDIHDTSDILVMADNVSDQTRKMIQQHEVRIEHVNVGHGAGTNSTTMTFAAKVSTLKRVVPILRKHTSGKHPNDFHMFMELREQGELLITPIPGYATHGETAWLSPLTDWSKV